MSANAVTFHRLYDCLCSITIKHELLKSVELANDLEQRESPGLGRPGLNEQKAGQGAILSCFRRSDASDLP